MPYQELEEIIDTKIRKAIRKHEMIVAFISSIIGLIFIMGLFHAILLNHAQIKTQCFLN
jgi:energy-converting hydrogenase Eha subunit F